MSSESLPLVPPSTTLPIPPSTLPWTLADEEALIKRENAISHLQLCIARRDQCEIDLITFRRKYSETVIKSDPILHSRHVLLINARKEAWEAYFKAYDALYPKTIEDILWIMAKAGHTQLIAPLMNLSKVTRNCIHLQPIMMNVKLGKWGRTQLHHCVRNGFTSSVKRLLSIRNINVNVKDDWRGYTPLHYAAANGHIEITRLLLQNGADVNARSNNGSSPLHVAIEESNLHVDIVKILLREKRADNARKRGDFILAKLIEEGLDSFSDSNNDLDSDSNNDIDSDSDSDSNSNSKLNEDLVEIVKLLLEKGADVNARNKNEETPLHSASTNGQIEITNLLLKNGADVNAVNNRDWTPLCEAVSKYFMHYRNEDKDFSPLEDEKYCPIFFEIIELLVENGAEVDVEYDRDNGFFLLHEAIDLRLDDRLDDLIVLLVNNGADINRRTFTNNMTPLHIAAEFYRPSIVSLLVERGADVNARTADGKTALTIAQSNDNTGIAAFLQAHDGIE